MRSATLLAVLWLCTTLPVAHAVKTSCKSGLTGDFRYTACGGFCKSTKAQNRA